VQLQDMNAQDFQFFPHELFGHISAYVLEKESRASVFRKREGVKNHTLAPVQGTQRTDRGTQTIDSLWDNHQFLPFELGLQPTLCSIPAAKRKNRVCL
jgi:hypothetical protein